MGTPCFEASSDIVASSSGSDLPQLSDQTVLEPTDKDTLGPSRLRYTRDRNRTSAPWAVCSGRKEARCLSRTGASTASSREPCGVALAKGARKVQRDGTAVPKPARLYIKLSGFTPPWARPFRPLLFRSHLGSSRFHESIHALFFCSFPSNPR